MIKETLEGPCGSKLHLDSTKFHPDDPGQDSPALVEYKGQYGTYHCAVDACEIGDGLELPGDVLDWLCSPSVEDSVERIFSTS